MSESATSRDTVWIPSVPLPFLGRRTNTCACGQKFRGRKRQAAYELHYRRAHQRDDAPENQAMVEIAWAEAQQIYTEVNADHASDGEDNVG